MLPFGRRFVPIDETFRRRTRTNWHALDLNVEGSILMPFGSKIMRRSLLAGSLATMALTLPASAIAASYTVTIANMNFGRLPKDIKVGDTITWVNNDSMAHTVTARDKSFDLRLAPGQKGSTPASKVGSFPFYCIYHSSMRGVLTVVAAK
jgi:plastocyanin